MMVYVCVCDGECFGNKGFLSQLLFFPNIIGALL